MMTAVSDDNEMNDLNEEEEEVFGLIMTTKGTQSRGEKFPKLFVHHLVYFLPFFIIIQRGSFNIKNNLAI